MKDFFSIQKISNKPFWPKMTRHLLDVNENIGILISKEPLNFLDPPFFIVIDSKNYPGFFSMNFPPFFRA